MTRAVVVYYSLTGNTAKVAEAIAAKLPADIERIAEAGSRTGTLGLLRSAYESVFNETPNILPLSKSLSDYDLVVLGCPAWGQNMASPMRALITRERGRLKQVALFCTVGAVGGRAAIREMAALCRRLPVATLVLTAKDLGSAAAEERIDAFVAKARAALPPLAACTGRR